tara:strand:+ start:417 stop:533 length:117 start_codon:yes stop_codon:yes gene_type:complete
MFSVDIAWHLDAFNLNRKQPIAKLVVVEAVTTIAPNRF